MRVESHDACRARRGSRDAVHVAADRRPPQHGTGGVDERDRRNTVCGDALRIDHVHRAAVVGAEGRQVEHRMPGRGKVVPAREAELRGRAFLHAVAVVIPGAAEPDERASRSDGEDTRRRRDVCAAELDTHCSAEPDAGLPRVPDARETAVLRPRLCCGGYGRREEDHHARTPASRSPRDACTRTALRTSSGRGSCWRSRTPSTQARRCTRARRSRPTSSSRCTGRTSDTTGTAGRTRSAPTRSAPSSLPPRRSERAMPLRPRRVLSVVSCTPRWRTPHRL